MENANAVNAGNLTERPKLNYLNNGYTLRSWLLTRDHKRIAILYLLSVSVFFLMGGLYAGAFHVGAAAADADDNVIYNSVTGALMFDADGSGAGAAIQFATLQAGLALTAADFLVI